MIHIFDVFIFYFSVPHAIVGIHVTMFIMQLFKEGLLHHHFLYTSCSEMEYENLYCMYSITI